MYGHGGKLKGCFRRLNGKDTECLPDDPGALTGPAASSLPARKETQTMPYNTCVESSERIGEIY